MLSVSNGTTTESILELCILAEFGCSMQSVRRPSLPNDPYKFIMRVFRESEKWKDGNGTPFNGPIAARTNAARYRARAFSRSWIWPVATAGNGWATLNFRGPVRPVIANLG
jgi:hypothetical protein